MDEAGPDEAGLGVWAAAFHARDDGLQRLLQRDQTEAALPEELLGDVEADLVDEQELHQPLIAQHGCRRGRTQPRVQGLPAGVGQPPALPGLGPLGVTGRLDEPALVQVVELGVQLAVVDAPDQCGGAPGGGPDLVAAARLEREEPQDRPGRGGEGCCRCHALTMPLPEASHP